MVIPDEVAETQSTNGVRCYATVLRKASRRMSQAYDVALEPSGIKTTQRAILVCVRREGPLTVGALADALVMDSGGLSHTLKPLFRDGLLSTSVDPKDKRNRLLAIEPEGLARIEASDHLFDEVQKRFEDAFGAAEAAALRNALRIITSDYFLRSFQEQGEAAGQAKRHVGRTLSEEDASGL